MVAASRTSVVAMLVAVEILIAGLAIWSVTNVAGWGNFHRVDYAASPLPAIAAGTSPVVVIDDVDSHVVVSPSSDGLVHVTDETTVHGWIAGSEHAQVLTAVRTPEGVRVYRPEGHFAIGTTNDRVAVQVPPMSRLQIVHADRCDVSGLRNGATVHTSDGHINLTDVSGNIFDLDSGDGNVSLANISVTGDNAQFHVRTSDGDVKATGVFSALGTYTIQTGDGKVDLRAQAGSNLSVAAQSDGDGSISINGNRHAGTTVKVGDGAATMSIHTQDGSIHIITNGA